MSERRRALALVAVLAAAMAALWLLGAEVVGPAAVRGASMQPLLEPGDRLLVDRWTLRQRLPRPGEVVLLLAADGRPMVKRVTRSSHPPEAEIWVEGDNAGESLDSRRFGALPASSVRGRVVFRYWPPSRIGPVGGVATERAGDLATR